MLVMGTFEHNIELEQALWTLEHAGIPQSSILVVPMVSEPAHSTRYITRSRDITSKGIEVGMACATACAVVGMSIGLISRFGPIFLSLFFAIGAFFIGFGFYLYLNRNTYRHLPKILPEVTVIVECPQDKSAAFIETMWKFRALTVGQID